MDTNIKGLSQLNEFLQQLPVKVETNILRGALRAGVNTVKHVAQGLIRSVSGKLAKGLKVGTRVKGGRVTASLKAKGPHGFVAQWLEFTGAKAHQITPKMAKALAFDGRVYRSVRHPGFRKKPFMRPALDQQQTAAPIAVGEYIKLRLTTKEGLNTAHIIVSGDE